MALLHGGGGIWPHHESGPEFYSVLEAPPARTFGLLSVSVASISEELKTAAVGAEYGPFGFNDFIIFVGAVPLIHPIPCTVDQVGVGQDLGRDEELIFYVVDETDEKDLEGYFIYEGIAGLTVPEQLDGVFSRFSPTGSDDPQSSYELFLQLQGGSLPAKLGGEIGALIGDNGYGFLFMEIPSKPASHEVSPCGGSPGVRTRNLPVKSRLL